MLSRPHQRCCNVAPGQRRVEPESLKQGTLGVAYRDQQHTRAEDDKREYMGFAAEGDAAEPWRQAHHDYGGGQTESHAPPARCGHKPRQQPARRPGHGADHAGAGAELRDGGGGFKHRVVDAEQSYAGRSEPHSHQLCSRDGAQYVDDLHSAEYAHHLEHTARQASVAWRPVHFSHDSGFSLARPLRTSKCSTLRPSSLGSENTVPKF